MPYQMGDPEPFTFDEKHPNGGWKIQSNGFIYFRHFLFLFFVNTHLNQYLFCYSIPPNMYIKCMRFYD